MAVTEFLEVLKLRQHFTSFRNLVLKGPEALPELSYEFVLVRHQSEERDRGFVYIVSLGQCLRGGMELAKPLAPPFSIHGEAARVVRLQS